MIPCGRLRAEPSRKKAQDKQNKVLRYSREAKKPDGVSDASKACFLRAVYAGLCPCAPQETEFLDFRTGGTKKKKGEKKS